MKKAAIIVVLAVLFLSTVFYIEPASTESPKAPATELSWQLAIGAALGFSLLVCFVMNLACSFFRDREKIAEAKGWFSARAVLPRRFLTPDGHIFATIRFYAMIASIILLLVVLAIAP